VRQQLFYKHARVHERKLASMPTCNAPTKAPETNGDHAFMLRNVSAEPKGRGSSVSQGKKCSKAVIAAASIAEKERATKG
jgi:hypothetical protein